VFDRFLVYVTPLYYMHLLHSYFICLLLSIKRGPKLPINGGPQYRTFHGSVMMMSISESYNSFVKLLAECPQCYCGKIRQMLAFFANVYFSKSFDTSDHSRCMVEFHRKKLFPNTSSLSGLECRTVFGFVALVPIISSPKRKLTNSTEQSPS
jgi:hypothetical protein